MKKKIHFILPSGGIRGSFQAGFLYLLFTKYKDKFEIYQIDGCSVGSLNGLLMCIDDPNYIKNMWLNFKTINDIFPSQSEIYGLKKFISAVYSLNSLAYSNNNKIKQIISNNKHKVNMNLLSKYNCCTVNIDTGKEEYINGSNENIFDYALASASPWILTPPIKINNNFYIDGALFNRDPIKNIKNSNADLILVLGSNRNLDMRKDIYGKNLLEFSNRLICLASSEKNIMNNNYLYKIEKEKNNIVVVDNLGLGDLSDTNLDYVENFIQENLKLGKEEGEKFAKKYLINSTSNNDGKKKLDYLSDDSNDSSDLSDFSDSNDSNYNDENDKEYNLEDKDHKNKYKINKKLIQNNMKKFKDLFSNK